MEKICDTCGFLKPITNFQPHKRLVSGKAVQQRANTCKPCVRKARIAAGSCVFCMRPTVGKHTSCSICLEAGAKRARNRRAKLRDAAFEHYGAQCAYCGQNQRIFLSIDHKNDDGAMHRKTLTMSIHRWLRDNDYPNGFQTLCMNCNYAKSLIGEAELLRILAESRTGGGQF